jgi:toxin ParE1/3/4
VARVRKTARATADLDEIWLFIAMDNVSAADRLIDRITERTRALADHPRLDVARPDIAPEARMLTIGDYLISYRILGSDVAINRVVHGARRLEGLFDEEP